MRLVDKITVAELRDMAEKIFGDMVKADVDVARKIMVVDAELHADIEQFMLESGSRQQDLWGINLYPDQFGTSDFIEYDSMINIKPRQGNRSRYVEDVEVRNQIAMIVGGVVHGD
jgi:hypothetical protein